MGYDFTLVFKRPLLNLFYTGSRGIIIHVQIYGNILSEQCLLHKEHLVLISLPVI